MGKYFLVFLLAFFVVGCNKEDIANAARKLDELKSAHCAEGNAEKRAALIAAIRLVEPYYPDDGACGIERKIRKIIDGVV